MANIIYNEQTREFHLSNSRISYIFCVLENGELGQIYYGKKLHHRDSFQHLIQMRTHSHTAYVYENNFLFSLDTIKQEYPSYGSTDFRDPAYEILQENGSTISRFSYVSHEIYAGKKRLKDLPAVYANQGSDCESVDITLKDELTGMKLVLSYTIFSDVDAICRSARFKNEGSEKLILNRALSMSVDLYESDFEMVHLDGAWSRERHVTTRKLAKGIQSVSSARGASSSDHNPFIALKRPDASENTGEVYGFCLVYSGNFLAQVEVDRYEVARVSLGINPFQFRWGLGPNESFQTPEAVMTYSDQGMTGMSLQFHHLFNNNLVRGKWKNQERPILINNWEATYFNFDEEKILQIAEKAKKLGVELFVLDDGWFGKRDDASSSLGDWYSDKNKLPEGVEGLSHKIEAMGLKFGLWFEPEMVNKVSDLYEAHPDWAIATPNRSMSHGRNQYVLDFSNPAVVDHIYGLMEKVLENSAISYVKWDMNRNITEAYGATLGAEHQGEFFHRYILGVYDLYERLITKFPEILFESCASGGCRFDAGMMYYAPQCWASDDTDAVERIKIQYGTSMVYPVASMGAHVSAVPNHQVHRVTSLDFRGHVAFFGAFGYELDPNQMTEEEQEKIREQVAFYKKYRKLIQYGDLIRLVTPFDNKGYAAWMTVSEDKKQAVLAYFKIWANPNPKLHKLKLSGLDPDKKYRCSRDGEVYYGDELMNMGFLPDQELTGATARNPKVIKKDSGKDAGDFTSQLYILECVED